MDEGPAKRGSSAWRLCSPIPYMDRDLLNYVPEHYTRAVCLHPGGRWDVQVCNLHPLWGEAGSVNLDGSVPLASSVGAYRWGALTMTSQTAK